MITQMLEHRISALPQLHCNEPVKRQVLLWPSCFEFVASYIIDLMILFEVRHTKCRPCTGNTCISHLPLLESYSRNSRNLLRKVSTHKYSAMSL